MASPHYKARFNENLKERADVFLERNKAVLEPIRQSLIAQYGELAGGSDLRLEVIEDKYGANYSARFSLHIGNQAICLARFTLDGYPACCALHMVNDFYAREGIDEKLLDDMFDTCSRTYTRTMGGSVNRVMFNFLEVTRQDKFRPTDVVEEYKEAQFQYPQWRKWAESKKNMIETQFVNHNTGRIIHNTTVIL